jgi:hypothetical protein
MKLVCAAWFGALVLLGLFASLICQFHKLLYFVVDIFLNEHAQVMVVLLGARDLRDLTKTHIIVVGLVEGKHDIDKVLTQLDNKSYTRFCRKSDHGFCRVDRYVSKLPVTLSEMPE